MGMKIAGLQKVSTIDYPGEICCVVFLWGCNFRCGFCYNSELVIGKSEGSFSEDEVLEFLERRVGKLDGVCISGGEPLMSLDLGFVRKIRDLGFKVKLDTNGSFPDKLREIIDLGLVDYVAMDVKGCREDYSKVVGVEADVSKIEESMKIVDEFSSKDDPAGPGGEFRTTIVPGLHDSENIIKMGEWMNKVCGGKPRRIFLQGFKPSGDMIDPEFMKKNEVFEEELLRLKGCIEDLFEEVGLRV
jgi:pyruvate formate lyase activating enzyme